MLLMLVVRWVVALVCQPSRFARAVWQVEMSWCVGAGGVTRGCGAFGGGGGLWSSAVMDLSSLWLILASVR